MSYILSSPEIHYVCQLIKCVHITVAGCTHWLIHTHLLRWFLNNKISRYSPKSLPLWQLAKCVCATETFSSHLFETVSFYCFTDGEERTYGGCEGPDAMYVKLISSDGHEFIVKREHALTSGTIKAMLSGPGEDSGKWNIKNTFLFRF